MRFGVLVVGVGGQGVLTVARWIGEAAADQGIGVRLGQLHGMSQRGGSVESTVLLGHGTSGFLPISGADIVLGLEPLEVARALPKMTLGAQVVANTAPVVPVLLTQRGAAYPSDPLAPVREHTGHVVTVDGLDLARRAGAERSLNVAMLGALAGTGSLPIDSDRLWDAVQARTHPDTHDSNRRAFELGLEATRS